MTTPPVQELTTPQLDEMITPQIVTTRLNEMTRQQREVIMREMATLRMDEIRILENWFRARQFAVAFFSLLLLVASMFYEGARIKISIYLWICFALVYVWLIRNRILSVYVSYQHRVPLSSSLLSAAFCFLTCIVAFYFYCQSQNLTISRILALCVLAILGSILVTVLLYNLRVNGVTRNGLNSWTTLQFLR